MKSPFSVIPIGHCAWHRVSHAITEKFVPQKLKQRPLSMVFVPNVNKPPSSRSAAVFQVTWSRGEYLHGGTNTLCVPLEGGRRDIFSYLIRIREKFSCLFSPHEAAPWSYKFLLYFPLTSN